MRDFTSPPDDSADPPSGTGNAFVPDPPPTSAQNTTIDTSALIDYNERFASAAPLRHRDALIDQVVASLVSAGKPNVVLIGSAGVGKTAVVEELARRIATDDPAIPSALSDWTIRELSLTWLVAGTMYRGAMEEKLQGVLDFATDPANRTILFIDEIHRVTGSSASGADAALSQVSQMLKPALARGDLRVIGATTSNEARALDDDPAFSRRFTRLIVDELTAEQTLDVLGDVRTRLSAHYGHKVSVTDEVLAQVVRVADTSSSMGSHRPDSAITLLDRAMADRVVAHTRAVADATAAGNTALVDQLRRVPALPLTAAHLSETARRLTTGNATRTALNTQSLSRLLKDRLRGQDGVIDTLVDRLRRVDLALFPSQRPTTWLFAGASGVGKSEATKLISRALTGADPIALNMTEYHNESSITRIIGAPPGYIGSDSKAELPFDTLESNPYRVILLDEFEKADRAVQRLFLSAFDEGYIRNSSGERLDLSKAVIIATTNAAREVLTNTPVGFGDPAPVSDKSLTRTLEQHFDAELLARFSLIVGFNPIDPGTYRDILASEYARLRAQAVGVDPLLETVLPERLDDAVLDSMVDESYLPSQGARPAARIVRRWIEDHA